MGRRVSILATSLLFSGLFGFAPAADAETCLSNSSGLKSCLTNDGDTYGRDPGGYFYDSLVQRTRLSRQETSRARSSDTSMRSSTWN